VTAVLPDLRRLYAFVAVAEELHFRQAAKRLAITQSPLSRMIKALEHDVGVALFVRTRRNVELTAAGEVLFTEARDLIRRTERAIRRARRTSGTASAVQDD
jgi:DNA-binding transcriptional LysR family regulator